MKSKEQQSAVTLPDGFVRWTAMFAGSCRCGKKIRRGQACLYDKEQRRLFCAACAKLPSEELEQLRRPAAAAKVMDRVKQIHVMARPLPPAVDEELANLLVRLRTEFANDYSARRLLVEVMRLHTDDDTLCIVMRYGDRCHGCGTKQSPGSAAIWCRSSHRIWCLECHGARK